MKSMTIELEETLTLNICNCTLIKVGNNQMNRQVQYCPSAFSGVLNNLLIRRFILLSHHL